MTREKKSELCSKFVPFLTLEYMMSAPENKLFDRKSAGIKPSQLGPLFSAFANADGGTVALGLADDGTVEGISAVGEGRLAELEEAPRIYCKPCPSYNVERLPVVNSRGVADELLLIHIWNAGEKLVRTTGDEVYLRIGDKTRVMRGEELRLLEYSRSARRFEDECDTDATIADLDASLLAEYKHHIHAGHLSTERVLRSRHFLRKVDGVDRLTNGAVLLFAENVAAFFPQCRLRFLRYDGTEARGGTRMNIVKDQNFDVNVIRQIQEGVKFVGYQLRDFTRLNPQTGRFETVPEYPEFAWQEAVVNAIVHREYALYGDYIRVQMFDDRLAVESPGAFPSMVTAENISSTRYSRNPHMARVLTEFGWVRELNEGVPRMYAEMQDFFLQQPEYEAKPLTVRLTLGNNIEARALRRQDHAKSMVGVECWECLSDDERKILTFLAGRLHAGSAEIAEYLGRNRATVNKRLKNLMEMGLVKSYGEVHDPTRIYDLAALV